MPKPKAAIISFAFVLLCHRHQCNAQDLIIDQVRKTVVYIRGDFACHEPLAVNGTPVVGADGKPVFQSTCNQVGTGFIISIPTPEFGKDQGVPLLVTSKHLIRHPREVVVGGGSEYFGTIMATANAIHPNDEGSFIAPLQILVKDRGYLSCSIDNRDPDADVAVCPLAISDSVYDFKSLPTDIFVTQAKIDAMRINETDEVLFSGLFLPYHGAKRNYPIVRHGKLALLPKERIPWDAPGSALSLRDLYLAEVTSWGGNSGSPVFLRLAGAREQGGISAGVQYLLLGVMQGYFYTDRPATLDTAEIAETAHLDVKLSDNSGIAAIVPADKILEIVSQPRIRAYVSLVKAGSYLKAGISAQADTSFKETISILQESDPGSPLLKEALKEYASFLGSTGHPTQANFQQRLSDQINGASKVPDDQLR